MLLPLAQHSRGSDQRTGEITLDKRADRAGWIRSGLKSKPDVAPQADLDRWIEFTQISLAAGIVRAEDHSLPSIDDLAI